MRHDLGHALTRGERMIHQSMATRALGLIPFRQKESGGGQPVEVGSATRAQNDVTEFLKRGAINDPPSKIPNRDSLNCGQKCLLSGFI